MDLINRILQFPQCEVFSYLNFRDFNRWMPDPHKDAARTRAFGGDEWKECLDLSTGHRRPKLLDLYESALRDRGGATYVQSFLMYDARNQPLYWLIFCTNHLRGLEEMKDAMWAVDRLGSFRFSDGHDAKQLDLLGDSFDDAWLADTIFEHFAGRKATAAEVKEFVLTSTPCYRFKDALAAIEREKKARVIRCPDGRRAGSYVEEREIELQFASKPLF